MTAHTVHWCKSWQGRPVRKPGECRHGNEFGTEVLNINQRLEPKGRGRRVIALDASICMDCGGDILGNLSLAEGLRACMDEHGWNREVGLRLYEIAEANEADLMAAPVLPIWCLHAFGWSGREIVDALNAGKLVPAELERAA